MVIHEIGPQPGTELQRMIREFEATFLAPLGGGRFFRVDYGEDRTAFIRSLGVGKCLAAEKDGKIVGLAEMAIVDLRHPDGIERPAFYIADIKLRPEARGTLTMGRLVQQGIAWGYQHTDFGFAMVLDATPIKPTAYTGRAGITALSEVARTMVVRLPVTPAGFSRDDERFLTGPEEGAAAHRRLAAGRYSIAGGSPEVRSSVEPAWLLHPGGRACARFEDRRNVRRLITDDGTELKPAYLSCFAFDDPHAAVDLVIAALHRADAMGYRALRLCMPPRDLTALQCLLGPGVVAGVPGAVYAVEGLPMAEWNFSASAV
jgi:hypothetical protein